MTMLFPIALPSRNTHPEYDGLIVAALVVAAVVFWAGTTLSYGWRFWTWPWRQWFRWR
jgi:hypothetical protein